MSSDEKLERTKWVINGRRLVITLVVWSVILAGSIAGYAWLYGAQLKAAGEQASAETVVFAIEGMHCTGCQDTIAEALRKEIGVVSADVSFENREAVVRYTPSKTTRLRLREIIGGQGYTATTKETRKP